MDIRCLIARYCNILLITGENEAHTRPRPLKIIFSDIQTKRDVLTNAKNLRKSENEVNKIYILTQI